MTGHVLQGLFDYKAVLTSIGWPMNTRTSGDEPSTQWEIHLFGNVEFREQGMPVALRLGPTTVALLCHLAASPYPLSRQAVLDMFYEDRETDDPGGNLRWHLSRLRRATSSKLWEISRDHLRFRHELCKVDCLEFDQAFTGNLEFKSDEVLAQALTLYRGPFLYDFRLSKAAQFSAWQIACRAAFELRYLNGLRLLIDRYYSAAQYQQGIIWAQRLVRSDLLAEDAHIRLIQLYLANEQYQAAQQELQFCREVLKQELNAEPGPELRELAARIRSAPSALVAVPTTIVSREGSRGTFVGREAELAVLRNAWQDVLDGRGAVLLIEGEAGGGKSRLVRAWAETLPSGVFVGSNCYELTQVLPYRPWIDLLERCLALRPTLNLTKLPAIWRHTIIQLAPGLSGRLGNEPRVPMADSLQELEQLFRAILSILVAAAEDQPLVVTIDDLQWADDASLRLFQYLASLIATEEPSVRSLMLIGCVRSEDVMDNPALQLALRSNWQLAARTIMLPPFDVAMVTALLEQYAPDTDSATRATQCLQLLRATAGNALLVRELLREHLQQVVEGQPR
jgi:DNA-binding SARP family transcriptional activator